ncbi:30S ribosomal protein S8 [Candidatus Profftella armatura (Diaphorina cf. continua)]|uniref:Small ribosomal subunit protein uS8 n=1 Tax=Candidatus Profftella armatura (Diaphorina cf. continua) TaxID=2661583 RepID=A0A7R6VYJ5_9PROT|nr:30S ribosomal protein S8 [Candidatus Profftella armatura (Diaphorina cf. continua)]BCG49462.1 30S ribosomal protein S8 [Candidatus Profftella armatura (Diaphorina cf. continua)]
MSMSDPIADMLTYIRNGQIVNKRKIIMPSSKIKIEIAKVLKNEGYIKDFFIIKCLKNKFELKILLKYYMNRPVIECLKRISRPGLRIYKNKNNIPKIMNGLGLVIISTSSGIITDRKARAMGIGGEIICYVS